jgi:CDP-glycerol glycerophosphotransferase (TagB/SpsB family)
MWLPHGQSDKGWKSRYFEALGGEDLLLIYGDRMREVLRAKNIALPQVSVGNFRWQFYQLHKEFYDRLMDQQFGQQRFVLYAPTWDDSEQNGSFWKAFDSLILAVPAHLHLLIKVHPNMQKTAPAKIERCRGIIEGMANISFIDDFPPIYPLLDRTDAYIGDMSSIGYDYLRFSRPMFFLTDRKVEPANNPSAHLMQCGTQILYEEIPELFERISDTSRAPAPWAFDHINPQVLLQSINRWVTT